MTADRWWVRKRGTVWTAIHPTLGVRGVTSTQQSAFGVAFRAARHERAKEET